MSDQDWDEIIYPQKKIFDYRLGDVWVYRDLLYMHVKRDFISVYKQSILGPLWFVIQPILTTVAFTIVFGKIAGISTEGVPTILFYLCGITCWNFFSESLTGVSNTFLENEIVFKKVHFPRLIPPLALIVSKFQKFLIQITVFAAIYVFFWTKPECTISPQWELIFLPVILLSTGLLALGLGLFITSLTSKYKDLTFLLSFGVQITMYLTPVIYPLSILPSDKQYLLFLNPMTSFLEAFKYSFFGKGFFHPGFIGYSVIISIIVFFCGLTVYVRTERNFVDSI